MNQKPEKTRQKQPTQADKTEPVVPAKTPVADTANLTKDEKDAVKKAIEDANKDKFPEGTTVEVGNDGTATITYPDKSTDTIKGSDLVEAKTPTTADQTDPKVPVNESKDSINKQDKLSKTGDGTNLSLYVGLILMSGSMLILLGNKRRKNKK